MRRLLRALLGCLMAAGALASFAAHAQQFPLPPKDWPEPIADRPVLPFILFDRLEYRSQERADVRAWDVQGWIGGDFNKLWLKSEGEQEVGGGTERADVRALYARLLRPFWYLQAGVRADARPEPSRGSAVLALQGIAPYWFNVEASAFLNDKGKLSGRLEAEYDLFFTQRLILQPRLETGFAASSEAERGLGSGFNDIELGLRLRYEIRREFAPYIGINWSRKLGGTADLARRANEDVTEKAIVVGLRIWY